MDALLCASHLCNRNDRQIYTMCFKQQSNRLVVFDPRGQLAMQFGGYYKVFKVCWFNIFCFLFCCAQNLFSQLKSAPCDSLTYRLALCLCLVNYNYGGLRAVAHVWQEFVLELRYRWENNYLIFGWVWAHVRNLRLHYIIICVVIFGVVTLKSRIVIWKYVLFFWFFFFYHQFLAWLVDLLISAVVFCIRSSR